LEKSIIRRVFPTILSGVWRRQALSSGPAFLREPEGGASRQAVLKNNGVFNL
jgi:hypothetical protein